MAYTELRPAGDLAGPLLCSWTAVTGAPGTVLPDGCLDLMWIAGELVVAGPDTAANPAGLPPGTQIAAVRFRPGAAPAVLGVPADELRDRRPLLADLWGPAVARELSERVGAAPDRIAALEAVVRDRLAAAPPVDPVAPVVVAALSARRSVGAVAELIGLSPRQLHRRCLAAFGYGAKTLDRVLRLQRLLALADRSAAGLAELAVTAGYADQAHLAHETRTLAGSTPSQLLLPRQQAAGTQQAAATRRDRQQAAGTQQAGATGPSRLLPPRQQAAGTRRTSPSSAR
ncbi:MAG TPA: helix-turn-helix domain-containing protein [Mycobacteriales bacterium]